MGDSYFEDKYGSGSHTYNLIAYDLTVWEPVNMKAAPMQAREVKNGGVIVL
jgi:hypothetical protein